VLKCPVAGFGFLHADWSPSSLIDRGSEYLGEVGVASVVYRSGCKPWCGLIHLDERVPGEKVSASSAKVPLIKPPYPALACLYCHAEGAFECVVGTSSIALCASCRTAGERRIEASSDFVRSPPKVASRPGELLPRGRLTVDETETWDLLPEAGR
jgi:hypothetical protein